MPASAIRRWSAPSKSRPEYHRRGRTGPAHGGRRNMRRIFGIAAAMLLVLAACGDGGGDGENAGFEPAEGGEERTVLVDYRHDEFASAFLQYYPEQVKVRPGDVVKFRQSWTGEPHSVTMGKVVNDLMEQAPLIMQYDSPEAALA